MTLRDFKERFNKTKDKEIDGNPGFISYCPSCQPEQKGKGPHLCVFEKDDWVKVRCIKGCDESQILRAMGLTEEDRKVPRQKVHAAKPAKPPSHEYFYHDAQGAPIFKKVRLYNWDDNKGWEKTFLQFGMNGEKGIAHLNGAAETLYNLPAVNKAIANGETVYVCEGEKACDAMAKAGHAATCQRSGAGKGRSKWLPDHTVQLQGASVVIVADRDEVGEIYAAQVAESLALADIPVRVVQSATTGDKDDAYDHLAAGLGIEDFVPRPDLAPSTPWTSLSDVDQKEVDWLFDRRFPRGMLSMIQGDPGEGKSTVARALVAMVTSGQAPSYWGMNGPPAAAIWLTKEESLAHSVAPALQRMGADLNKCFALNLEPRDGEPTPEFIMDERGAEMLQRKIEQTGAAIVVIDPMMSFFDAKTDIHRQNEVRQTLDRLIRIASSTGASVVGIVHQNKGGSANAIYRAIGSIDFPAAARTAFMVAHDPDDRDKKALAQHKNNLGPHADTMGFAILEDGTVEWDPDCTLDADRLCEPPNTKAKKEKTDACEEWLEKELAYGQCEVRSLVERAGEQGFSKRLLYQVAADAKVARGYQPTSGHRGPAWWAKKGYDWESHEWPDPFAED